MSLLSERQTQIHRSVGDSYDDNHPSPWSFPIRNALTPMEFWGAKVGRIEERKRGDECRKLGTTMPRFFTPTNNQQQAFGNDARNHSGY